MSMQGSLREVDVPNVIELARQMSAPAAIHFLVGGNEEGWIFVEDGRVVHASVGDLQGMKALYQLFPLQEGAFDIRVGSAAPRKTIEGEWNNVLLDVLRYLDDKAAEFHGAPKSAPPLGMKLQTLLMESDFQGAAVVGRDGLIYASHLPEQIADEDLLGAVAASIFALSARSVRQLKRGNLQRTLVQGSEGNIIVTLVNEEALFVGLASRTTNLGMVFAEARAISAKLAEQLMVRE